MTVLCPCSVLTLCSPSGHAVIFTQTRPALEIPLEVLDILFKLTDIKKVTLELAATKKFFSDNGMNAIPFVELCRIAKKYVGEISFGTFNFFKYQLACDFPVQGPFEVNDHMHVKNVAQFLRTVAYAVWFIAPHFATNAGLTSSRNVTSFLRYALFSEDADMYRNLIADPHYIPYEEITLNPLDKHNLDLEASRLACI